ncbi:peptide methionine sulfoxide reductase [Salinisphaera dokdonensis CL-ES53]|uniref:Peptide methionine sulfoxide reductase MsrA n=2 Tax=Salinisphaera TaxID=180541 RepID=A0ABV2AY28_9GAMM
MALAVIGCAGALLWPLLVPAAAEAEAIDVPTAEQPIATAPTGMQTAVLAGGCFWGIEAVFEHVEGVTDVVSGYAGGDADTASYRATSSGRTGHAEAVRIEYDSAVIGYTDLLQIYFSVAHDPTQVGGQGPDRGSQYRSAIFALDAGQNRAAQDYIAQLDDADVYDAPIATEVTPIAADAFYPAEAYHQDFATRNPNHPYIRHWDAPKVSALQARFGDRYRARPALPLASG